MKLSKAHSYAAVGATLLTAVGVSGCKPPSVPDVPSFPGHATEQVQPQSSTLGGQLDKYSGNGFSSQLDKYSGNGFGSQLDKYSGNGFSSQLNKYGVNGYGH